MAKYFSEYFAFGPSFVVPDENDPEMWMKGDDYCEHALQHYNETQGVEFELVKVVGYCPILVAYYTCYHFNFEAKPKHGIGADQPPNLFFAEAGDSVKGKYVNVCMILDPSSPEAVKGCYVCPELLLHPKDFVVFGREPAILRDSQEEE